MNKVKENCPKCNLKYSIEPSFYTGSMYVSYGVGIAVAVAAYVITLLIGFNFGPIGILLSIVLALVLTMPYIGAVSKSIWAHMFFKFNPEIAKKKMIQELEEYYGSLFEHELLIQINQVATFVEAPEGKTLIKPGQFIKSMPLLLSGSIKILRPDSDGDELLLYHLERGDTCAMSMTCCMGNTKSEIHAVTETDTKLLMIPIEKMEEWSSKYTTWRNFVFTSYHNRMMELLESVDNIAFNNMDERLGNYIFDKVKILNSKHIYITHKEIAYDLHTSRVVVSRLLKKMENNHLVKLHRSFIEVL